MGKIIFVTGSDTGAGKTVLTGLMLAALREANQNALAMKPFCSGGMADIVFLNRIQGNCLSRREINPYYFPQPVSPAVTLLKRDKEIDIKQVVKSIRSMQARCDVLLVEGSGGILVPLTSQFTVADLILELGCEVVIASPNRLGTINHTMLTVNYLRNACPAFQNGMRVLQVVLMGLAHPDPSCASNGRMLQKLLGPTPLHFVPYVGRQAADARMISRNLKKVRKTLATILEIHKVCIPVLWKKRRTMKKKPVQKASFSGDSKELSEGCLGTVQVRKNNSSNC